MKASLRRVASASLVLPLLLLSGCMFTTRRLPIPKVPLITQPATAVYDIAWHLESGTVFFGGVAPLSFSKRSISSKVNRSALPAR